MAFNMNRPIIKGTANHKASIAKATQKSIVSQARTTADASLVGAGKSLGESYIPAAMDYTINQKGIEFADVKKEGGEGKSGKSSKPKKMKKAKPKKLKVKTKGPDLKKRIVPEYNPPKEEGLPTDYIKPPKNKKKNKTKRDKSKDKKATKVEALKPKKVKVENPNTDPKISKVDVPTYEAPYIEEPEDADVDDFSYIENDNTNSSAQSGSAKPKPYRNWKRRQEEENIAAAEANKKRLEESSRQRATNNSTKMDPKKPELLPVDTPETKLSSADPTPESKKTPKAHENPNYNVEAPKYDREGNLISMGGNTNSPGYSYEQESDQWTYNGVPIESHEVPEEFVDSQSEQNEERQVAKKNKNLNSNTPSNKPVEVDPIQPQPRAEPVVEEKKTPTTTEKPKISDFKTKKNPFGGTLTAKDQYEKALKEYYSKSPATMRDNRIYRNAIKGGVVQQNMIKSGYKPE